MTNTVVVVGAGLCRARRHRRARRRRAPRDAPRRRERPRARRPGVLVVRRAVPGRLARAAPAGGQGLRRAGAGRLVRLRAVRRRRPLGPGMGRGVRSFAAGDMRSWLADQGVRWFPLVQWAERGGYEAGGHGNSVPRFHVTWGTGPGILEPFVRALLDARNAGLVDVRFRHRVTGLVTTDGVVTGVRGDVLASDGVDRARTELPRPSSRPFEIAAGVVDRDRRHRRQPRPRARARGRGPRGPCPPHAVRRAGPRGRLRHRGGPRLGRRRRARGPHVALPRGHHQPLAGLEPARHPHPRRGRARCGSTPTATGCPHRCSPASTPSAPSSTSPRAATTTRGSCSTRRSSAPSSPCPAPSRTPT